MTIYGVTNSVFAVTGRKGRVPDNNHGVTYPVCVVTTAKRAVTNTICNANEQGNVANRPENGANGHGNGANRHGNGANGPGNGRKSEQKTVGATRWVARKTGKPPGDPNVSNNTKKEERSH